MRFYLYCVSDELDGASVEGLKGVAGADVRLHARGRLSAVVSALEGERAAVTRENLRAHNGVNAHVLARVTPLPFRFGTLASETQLSDYVGVNERALVEALARVRGCVEMCVKLRLAGDAEAATVESEDESDIDAEATRAAVESNVGGRGTAFLLAKRRELLGAESLKARAEAASERVAAAFEGVARESVVRLSPEGPIVLRASHLVARADVDEYRARVRELEAGPGGLHALTSGPWPPYSFGPARV